MKRGMTGDYSWEQPRSDTWNYTVDVLIIGIEMTSFELVISMHFFMF